MKVVKRVLLVAMLVSVAVAQSIDPPLSDSRLTIHTLVREDIFAGFLADDIERFERGEKNIKLLMEKRPTEKASLLAWQGGAALYRAVRAHEANQADEFKRFYQQSLDRFAQAQQLNPQDGGVAAVTGGSYAVFADRLPKELQAHAWTEVYENYQRLYKEQGNFLDRLPVHFGGEVLGGLAQAAQRTGRSQEVGQYLEKLLAIMPDSPYGRMAAKWKENPKTAASASITCLVCHEQGRLGAKLKALDSK